MPVLTISIRLLFIAACSWAGAFLVPAGRWGGVFAGVLAGGMVAVEWWWQRRRHESIKILDTSVVIDGRIADIAKTGFLDGTFIFPRFVLQELQRLADATDKLKRNRGRHGLDTIAFLQRLPGLTIKMGEHDYPDCPTAESKLIQLAKNTGGKLLTNDINLNKIASLQGIPVLNVNDLSNAVKTVVLPGEEMAIKIIKEGKEPGQGVGYLDDGTMVVVESGSQLLNHKLVVSVTSVLQTAAGRMVFAKVKNGERG